MKLTILRHGQTDANINQICQGSDEPLNDTGKKQASKTAEELKNESFDVVFVSTHTRTQQTANIILQYHKDTPRIDDSQIREVENGDWAGKSQAFKKSERVRIAKENGIETWQVQAPNGESIDQGIQRGKDFVDWLKTQEYGNVLMVTHGHIALGIHQYLLRFDWDDWEKYRLQNAKFSVFELAEEPKLLNRAL